MSFSRFSFLTRLLCGVLLVCVIFSSARATSDQPVPVPEKRGRPIYHRLTCQGDLPSPDNPMWPDSIDKTKYPDLLTLCAWIGDRLPTVGCICDDSMPDNAACQQDLGHPDLFRWFELWSECTWQCRCDIDQKQKATGLDRLASLADRLSAIPEADISSSASEDGSSRERSRFPSYPYISRPPGSDSEDMQSRGAIEQPAAVEADHEPFSFSAAEQCAIQRQAPCKCKGSCTSVAQACAYGGSVCKCTAKPFFQSGPFGQFRGQCGGVIKGRWRRKSKRQLGIRPIKINGVAGENSTTVDLSGAVDVRPGVTAAARQGDERSVNSTARGNGSTYDDYARGGRNLTLSIANATISNGSRLEDLGTVFLDSETGEQVACPCNESYVSYACCATEDGMLWEPAHHKLGTLLVETA